MRLKFARLINLMVLFTFVLTSCQPPAGMPFQPDAAQPQPKVAIQSADDSTAPSDSEDRHLKGPSPEELARVAALPPDQQPSIKILKVENETPEQTAARQARRREFLKRVAAGDPAAKAEYKTRFKTMAMLNCTNSPGMGNPDTCPTGGAPDPWTGLSPAGASYTCSTPGQITVQGTANDSESISRVYISITNVGTGVVVDEYTWCPLAILWPTLITRCDYQTRSFTRVMNVPADGTYRVDYRCDDPISAGDPALASVTFTTTNCTPPYAPTIGSWSPTGPTYNCSATGGNLNWSFNATDLNNDITYMSASITPSAGVRGTPNAITIGGSGNRTHSGIFGLPADGAYTITFYARDSGNLSATQTVNVTVSNCKSAPTITTWSPGATINCALTGGALAWSFTATDNQSDLTSMFVSISPTTGVSGAPAGTAFTARASYTFAGNFVLTTDGTYTLTFRATDADGNITNQTQVVTTSNCKAAPTITAWSPNTAAVTCAAGYLNWSFTATDTQSNLTSLEYSIKDAGNNLIDGQLSTFAATGSQSFSGTVLLPFDGSFTLTFKATDSTGATDIKTQSITTTGCNPKPYFNPAEIVPGNGAVSCAGSGGKLAISMTARDYQSDMVSTRVDIYLGATVVYTDTDNFTARAMYTHVDSVQLPQDGTFDVWFTATDSGGRQETTTRTITTTGCDPRPYFVAWTPGATYDCNGGPVNFSVQVGDYQSDLVKIEATLHPVPEAGANPNTITFAATAGQTHTGALYLPDDGTYTITFQAWDANGYSRTMTQTFTTTLCTPKPLITAYAPNTPTYTCVNGRLSWSATAIDYQNDLNKITIDIQDNGNSSIPGMPLTYNFANTGSQTVNDNLVLPFEGAFSIIINAYDATGHVAQQVVHGFNTAQCDPNPRVISFSPSAPTLSCGPAPDYWINWSVTVGDYQGDLQSVEIKVVDAYNLTHTITQPFSGTNYNRTINGRTQIATNGVATITFTATDSAGNTGSAGHTFTANDCTDVVPAPQIATRAGSLSNTYGYANGTSTSALFFQPQGMGTSPWGDIFAADMMNDKIRMINATTGAVTTFAGGAKGKLDGVGAAALFKEPAGVAYDQGGSAWSIADDFVYIADSGNNLIRRISRSTSSVTTFAGDGLGGSLINGGTLTTSRFSSPKDVAVSRNIGNYLYVADTFNNAIRRINLDTNAISTFTTAVTRPWGIDVDSVGNVWVAEPQTGRVAKFNSVGGALMEQHTVGQPWDVTIDMFDNVFFSDASTNTVKRVSNGVVFGVGGTTTGGTDGPIGSAQLNGPRGLVISRGQLFVSEDANNRIRQMSTGSYLWGAGTGPQAPQITSVI